MVESMYLVVNVMLSLMSFMSSPPALCNLSVRTVVRLCTLGVLNSGVSLVFPNCDDIYMSCRYDISLNFTDGLCACVVLCSPVIPLSVRLSWYPMLWVWLLR